KSLVSKRVKTIISSLVFVVAIVLVLFKMTACAKLAGPESGSVDSLSVGEQLTSLDGLNTIASDKSVVFILIPKKEDSSVKKEIIQSIDSAKQKLEAKGIKVGFYTLKTDSPDYSIASGQSSPLPAIIIMSKGGGQEVVKSGDINESRILQSYVASLR
ncbi:MAG: hypothetical protein HQK53_16515, partial [Oligoflexia bacterium]|nr:hypothetical protein [Oligoflexia bacterium]